jgi:glycosyltransferase involved in cell wall biosynthesis
MRVLVVEQEFRGHYFLYLADLIPGLADLVDEVIVAITPRARESVEFQRLLAPLANRADIQPVVPVTDSSMTLSSRIRMLGNLRQAVRRFKPQYVLVPSGDGQTSFMGFHSALYGTGLPGGVPGEVGILYGYGPIQAGFKNRLKDIFYTQTQRLSGWKKIHYVNAMIYESIRSRGGSLAARADVLPSPVPANARIGKTESRRRLGIPEDGRYIGLAAELDCRKAIDRLLAAFRAAAGPHDRLLLAGRVDPRFALLVETQYMDLVKRDRIILRNHYFDRPTAQLIFDALDVGCTPHPWHGDISATLLHTIAAGRPVLVNNFGWMDSMVRRFGFGWSCNVLDPEAFPRMIRTALEESAGYQETAATRRLLDFHAPANFTASWLAGIRETIRLPPDDRRKTWWWVLDALDGTHRVAM